MKTKKPLLHISAEINDMKVDMYYVSIAQAKHFNPIAHNFEIIGERHGYI